MVGIKWWQYFILIGVWVTPVVCIYQNSSKLYTYNLYISLYVSFTLKENVEL